MTFVILPIGATEQHGPHLPVDVDTRVAAEAVRVLAERLATGADTGDTEAATGAFALPALPYGSSGEHQMFAGTVSIGTEALTTVLIEIGRSVGTWADRLLVVTGHGGNRDALVAASHVLRAEGRDVAWAECRSAESARDTHAGHAETSLMLALAPELVAMDRAEPGCSEPLEEILPELRARGMAAVTANGVLGDPTTATAAEGRRLWAALHDDLATRVARWEPGTDGRLR